MLAFASLDVSKNQSGQEDNNGHLVKHGSSHLQQIIMNVVDTFTLHNPVIYNYSQKKCNEGKHWRVVQTHIVKKLIRIIFHLENNQIDFDANLLR